jgi:adenylate cyclase
MFTDMVGSTALAQTDEAEALRLRDEQEQLVRPLFAAHEGREIKSMGDGYLADFDSALRAVQCAIDIQQRLHERNLQSGRSPLSLRIGIHLGDVEARGADIFGDSVNIASRIEPLAEPGGICVTEPVFGQVRNKIPNKLERLPPTALKGLHASIDIYRVVLPWTGQDSPSENSGPTGIAVLPFANISPDPKDEYFADGLTEELINVLSQFRELRVISRTSVMLYKATPKSASQIGVELGVASILEGSVRKAGTRLRITAQLIDARSDRHLWARTYQQELDDVFAIQAGIAKQVAEALKIELRATESARLETRPVVRPESYLAYLKGRSLIQQQFSEAGLREAKARFEEAISLDDRNAAAHSGLADVAWLSASWYPTVPGATWKNAARASAARAIELDPNLAEAHASLALGWWADCDMVAAEREFRIALSLNPSYSPAHRWYAELLEDEARTDEAVVEHSLAEATDPLSPITLFRFALLLVLLGRLEEALTKIRKLGEVEPGSSRYHGILAQYYFHNSELERSLEEAEKVLEVEPESQYTRIYRALICAHSGDSDKAKDLLRKEEEMRPETPFNALFIGEVYGVIGELDDCFRWLDRARELGSVEVGWLRLGAGAKAIREDPRFKVWLMKMNLA